MNSEELMHKYQQLVNTPLDSTYLNSESGESVTPILQTSSIRILVVRTTKNPKIVFVEVEIWLPGNNSNHISSNSTNSLHGSDEDLGSLLSRMIESLQYLHRLHESGFILDVIRHDCLWTASRSFKKSPSRETFELLLPP